MYCAMYSSLHVSDHLFVSNDASAGSGHVRGDPVRCLTLVLFFFLLGRLQLLSQQGLASRSN